MKPFWKTKQFQLRWNEPLGDSVCPYAYRWVLIFFGYSLRVHRWIRSDDKRYMHDHGWSFTTLVLKGHYFDVSEKDGVISRDKVHVFTYRKRPAEHRHYVEVPECGCWTILLCDRPRRNWGFWISGKFKRPLKYFHKYGHPPCSEQ